VASAAAASNDRRCINYRRAGVRLAAPMATVVCGRDVRTADMPACGRRSARILEIRGLTRIINSSSALGKLSTVSRWYIIALTDVFYLSHPVTMLRSR